MSDWEKVTLANYTAIPVYQTIQSTQDHITTKVRSSYYPKLNTKLTNYNFKGLKYDWTSFTDDSKWNLNEWVYLTLTISVQNQLNHLFSKLFRLYFNHTAIPHSYLILYWREVYFWVLLIYKQCGLRLQLVQWLS